MSNDAYLPVGWPRFIGRVGVEALRAAADRVASRAGTPRGPDDIRLEWLRTTITGGGGIESFEIVSHHHGTAQHVLLALGGNGFPPTAFVKLTPVRPAERIFHTMVGLGDTEERLYRELRPLWAGVMPGYLDRPALQDLSYFCITSLGTETRRDAERDVLCTYLDALAAASGPLLDEDEAWRQYRITAVHAYLAAAITVVFGARLQSEEIGGTAFERAVAALDDLDTVGAIGSEAAASSPRRIPTTAAAPPDGR